jgi:hypothetical protein
LYYRTFVRHAVASEEPLNLLVLSVLLAGCSPTKDLIDAGETGLAIGDSASQTPGDSQNQAAETGGTAETRETGDSAETTVDECTSDGGAAVADGFALERFFDLSAQVGGTGQLNDVHVGSAAYGADVLFTANNVAENSSGIGKLDADGTFLGWLVDPDSGALPRNTYLEMAFGGFLLACSSVGATAVSAVSDEGSVSIFSDFLDCEGMDYADAGDGRDRLYASAYVPGQVFAFDAEGESEVVIENLGVVTDIEVPPAGSAFGTGLYTIDQSGAGIRIWDPVSDSTTDFKAYDGSWGTGETLAFSDPAGPFGDHAWHLAISGTVERIGPDGTVTAIASGGELLFTNFTTGLAFSEDGSALYLTGEVTTLWKLRKCRD